MNEIQATGTLTVSKNGVTASDTFAINVTMSGDDYVAGTQVIGTSNETIALADIGTIGWVLIKNLDSTNFVEIGDDGTNYTVKLAAGEGCLFRFSGSSINLKADTAACRVKYLVLEA